MTWDILFTLDAHVLSLPGQLYRQGAELLHVGTDHDHRGGRSEQW